MEAEDDNWLPLESNPEVITKFTDDLGFDSTKYSFHDLLSVEEWAQEMIPKPVVAVLFLFPINANQEEFAEEEEEKIKAEGQVVSSNLFYMKQYAANACGTIAVIHSLVNLSSINPDLIKKDSYLSKFIENTKGLDPKERGKYFQKSKEVKALHKEAVEKGDTNVEEDVNTHFIAFVEKDGFLYELDGRKEFPINHGECKPEELLPKACKAIQKFMERDPEEIKFTLMAVAPPQSE